MGPIDPNLTFTLELELEVHAIDTFLEHMTFAAGEFTWPRVISLETGPQNRPAPIFDPDVVATLKRVGPLLDKAKQITIRLAPIGGVFVGRRPDGQSFFVSVTTKPHEGVYAHATDCVRVLTHVARRLLSRGVAVKGAVERRDAGACIPLVPLAKTRRPLVVTTSAEVEAAYERPDDFWSAGWSVEDFGERRLVTRCQDVVSKGDVLREIIDHQWQMARASRAKQTKYGTPTVSEEERSTYEAGEPRLVPVGRDASTNLVEYSCALRRGEHLRGFEIFYLRSLVQDKRMQDGSPVSAVRVVFAEKWMADEEKRPLLDNGIDVFYEDDAAELVQVAR